MTNEIKKNKTANKFAVVDREFSLIKIIKEVTIKCLEFLFS